MVLLTEPAMNLNELKRLKHVRMKAMTSRNVNILKDEMFYAAERLKQKKKK